jgi:hypothetical protein
MKESQSQQILRQLIEGTGITPQHALNKFGCFRLAARIADLRSAGYNIKTTMLRHNDKKFAYYTLEN